MIHSHFCLHVLVGRVASPAMVVGIPIKLLHEAQGLIVTLELTNGQTYRGKLHQVEDQMNVQLTQVTVTARDGKLSHMEQCFVRGSSVRFFIVPDNLKQAPFFDTEKRGKGIGMGRGRAIIAAAKSNRPY